MTVTEQKPSFWDKFRLLMSGECAPITILSILKNGSLGIGAAPTAIVYHFERQNCADLLFTTDRDVTYERKKCRKLKQLHVILWLIGI
jgi:hypothetical protein